MSRCTRSMTARRHARGLTIMMCTKPPPALRKRKRGLGPVETLAQIAVHRWWTNLRRSTTSTILAKWWRRVQRHRPVNERDPITMEQVSRCRSPEDGGKWFHITTEAGHRYRYAAEPLRRYLLARHSPEEPLQRRCLNRVELMRLDRYCQHQLAECTASALLSTDTKVRRDQAHSMQELTFFIEDEIQSALSTIRSTIQSTPTNNVTIEMLHRQLLCTESMLSLNDLLPQIRRLGPDTIGHIVTNILAPAQTELISRMWEVDASLTADINYHLHWLLTDLRAACE